MGTGARLELFNVEKITLFNPVVFYVEKKFESILSRNLGIAKHKKIKTDFTSSKRIRRNHTIRK